MEIVFSGLSLKAICGVEDYHLHLQKVIAEFETDNHSLFKSIHETVNRTKFHTHVQNISKLYTWGTSTEIIEAATLFQVEVYVAIVIDQEFPCGFSIHQSQYLF